MTPRERSLLRYGRGIHIARLTVILVWLLSTAAALAGVRMYHYRGNQPSRWRFQDVAAASSDAKLDWSTYLGDQNESSVRMIAVDGAGNTYAVGRRTFHDGTATYEVAVTKVDPSGALVYRAYLGGKGLDDALGIAADDSGNAYVVGHTTSPNFPLRNPHQARPAGGFITKLGPDGALLYSTYFGGTAQDSVNAVAADIAGSAYITGETYSASLPITPGAPQQTGAVSLANPPIASTAFAGKLNPSGDRFVYLSYLGGPVGGLSIGGCTGSVCLNIARYDRGLALAVDRSGNAYIAGVSNKQFPTTSGALQKTVAGPFVVKMNSAGTAILYSTGLGGSFYHALEYDRPTAIAADDSGDAYVTGVTASASFPVTAGALQTAFAGPTSSNPLNPPPYDAFVAKLNSGGTALLYSTYLGGPGDDAANSLALDSAGSAYVAGSSTSGRFAPDPTLPPGTDFVARLNSAGSELTYAASLPNGSAGQGIALDRFGRLRLAGAAAILSSLDLSGDAAHGILAVSNSAASVVSGRVAPGELVSIWGQGIGPATPAGAILAGDRIATTIAGTQVFFDDVAAPLLYVSERQINAVVPYEVAGKLMTSIRVFRDGTEVSAFPLGVTSAMPEIFKHPDGAAAALNQNLTVNSSANPAAPGSIVVIYGTGAGVLNPPAIDGSVANPPTLIPELTVDGFYILYAGAAPTLVSGVFQVNLQLPQNLVVAGGKARINVAVGTSVSEPAYIYVAQ